MVLVQMFSDNTAKNLNGTGFTAYAVHVVLLNGSYCYMRWLIENGHSPAGFLSVRREERREGMGRRETMEKSLMYWFTWSSAVDIEEARSTRGQHVNQKTRMSILHGERKRMEETLKGRV